MQPTKTIELYNKSIVIDFYGEGKFHYYKNRATGERIIGVTTATGVVDKSRPLIIWATRLAKTHLVELLGNGTIIAEEHIEEATKLHEVRKQEAATAGTLVHEWAEKFIAGEDPEMPTDEKVLNGVTAFLNWVGQEDIKFYESEMMVYSKKHNYVGTLDAIAKIKNKICVIDFKTSSGVYSEMRYQVAAYQMAYEEQTGKKLSGPRYLIRFDKDDGEFHVHNLDEDKDNYKKDCEAFLAALTLKRREKELSTWKE